MFKQLLSIILIIILTGSLITQVGISSVNALADPATGIKASSKFGTLQLDHSEYDVTYVNNTTVKVSGTIDTLDSINKMVTIIFTLPDGTTKGSQIAYNGDGTFQTVFPLDSNSQKGTYSVSASYAQNTLGALTFTVKLVPVSKSTLPISSPPIKSSQNNPLLPTTNNQQNVPAQTIPDSITQTPSKLPKWIKKTFVSYAQGDISEDELLNAITFLVQNNIIKISSGNSNSATPSTSNPTTNSPPTITQSNSKSSSNYLVDVQINLKKDQIEFGEPLTFQVNFNPVIDNTPVNVVIKNSTGSIVYQTGSATIEQNYAKQTTKIYRITILPDLFSNGQYTLEVQFGSDDKILGKQTKQFTYVNNKDSVGNKYIQNYFPTFMDIGTNFNFNTLNRAFNDIPNIDPCIFSCKKIISERIEDKTNCSYNLQSCYDIWLVEFENSSDAKKYGATSYQWQGTPSSAGNYLAITDTTEINSDSKQCFEYGGGYFSANGVFGLLKCSSGNFVIIIDNTDKIAQEIANATSKKIDSNPPK